MSYTSDSTPNGGRSRNTTANLWLPLLALGVLVAAGVLAVNSTGRPPAPVAESTPDPPAEGGATGLPATAAGIPPSATPSAPGPVEPGPEVPARVDVVIPSGTPVTLRLGETISTKTALVGDRFTARLVLPVMVNGVTALPRDAEIAGRVILAEQPGKASGRGRLQLAFDTARFDGLSIPLHSRSAVFQGRSGAKRDRELVGGGAAAGGVVGGVLGKSLGDAAKGAVIGAAAGGAVSLLTRGPQLELAAGTQLRFTLDQAVTVPRPTES